MHCVCPILCRKQKKFFYSVCSSFFYLISLTLAVFLRKPIAHQCSSQSPRLEVVRIKLPAVLTIGLINWCK